MDNLKKDAGVAYTDMTHYMDGCWEIHNEASIDVKLLVEEFIQDFIENDPVEFIDSIARKQAIQMPDYIVELARATMRVAEAGAAFDDARASYDKNKASLIAKNLSNPQD